MWALLQLADSAFPTGGFAHSAGMEAAIQAGTFAGVEPFCVELLDQLAHGSLPLVTAVHDDPARATDIDALAQALLWNHVAARASRAQGRALLDIAARSFNVPRVQIQHLAPAWGFVCRALGVARDESLAAFLHVGLRGALSAAVRLGACGPAEAQAIQLRLHPALDRALATGRTLPLDEVAQTSPVIELVQGTQDRLYSRLFQS